MKDKPKCPHWDEKNQKCKLMDIVEDLSRSNTLLAQTVEAYGAQTTILGPVPGSHGQVVGSSPIPQPPNTMLETLGKIGSTIFPSPSDKKRPIWGQEEESKKKQEYWEKELEKMDEKKEKEK